MHAISPPSYAAVSAASSPAITSPALALLSAALDPTGFICIRGIGKGKQPSQKFYAPGDYQGAVNEAMRLSNAGYDAYFATSTFLTKESGEATNVNGVKLFKLDLDVGKDDPKKYASKKDAVVALTDFCAKTKLPMPVLVDSGGGVHVYWIMHEALEAGAGRLYAEKLKAVTIGYGLKADRTVTGDIARILRIPGSLNYKRVVARPVVLKTAVDVHDTDTLLDLIDAAYSAVGAPATAPAPVPSMLGGIAIPAHLKGVQLDATTRQLLTGKPKSFSILLERSVSGAGCAQVLDIYENQVATEYGRWRSGLSIAQFCSDRETAIHDISKHHDEYTPEETTRKAADIAAPHFCSTFEAQRPDLCKSCKHKGRITSPIQLGAVDDATAGISNDDAVATVRAAEERAKAGDVGAPFAPAVIDALRTVQKLDRAEFQRLRKALKDANRNVSMKALDEAIGGDSRSEERSTADMLVSIARERCVFFHDADNEPYATFTLDDHRECWHMHSTGFREWLSYQFYQGCGTAPTELSMTTALSTLAGQAKFEGEETAVAVRVAKHGDDYYIDLRDEQWQAVRVTATGWQVIQSPPVMFIRTSAMRALPHPVAGGSIDDLWNFANIDTDDRLLVLAWMIEAFRPDTPYPVLELFAEQGAAKSFTQTVIRELIDPNKGNLRAKPKTIDDLFVTAKASHITSLENLSFLSPDFQDALCSLATGAGYGGRTLYTNSEEYIFEVKRLIMMNGISVVATRQDLMDRTLLVSLPTLVIRRAETELQNEFAQLKPQIFGALLALFAGSLAILPSVHLAPDSLPRMADFAHIGEAVFRASGRPAGEFLSKYHDKRKHGVAQTIEANPVAAAAIAWLDRNPTGFTGPLNQLYERLSPMRTDGEQWPKSVRGFGDSLRRVAPAMRMLGYEVKELGRQRDGLHWQLKGDIYLQS